MIPGHAADQTQTRFWNTWNATHRENGVVEVSRRQAQVVADWLNATGRRDLDILEVGCGACWFAPDLMRFGRYTGTDLSDEVLDRARMRYPGASFIAGDFGTLEFHAGHYDVIVSLEVLSHVADQDAFIAKMARLLKPGGLLLLATQNKPALLRNTIPPPQPGQLRRWVDARELRALVEPHLAVETIFSVTPQFNRGILRVINSHKLNAMAGRVAPPLVALSKRLQERAGLGWTLMMRAQKR